MTTQKRTTIRKDVLRIYKRLFKGEYTPEIDRERKEICKTYGITLTQLSNIEAECEDSLECVM